MTQTRLNNVLILHVHKNHTDQLCLTEVGNEFVKGFSHREALFGTFLPTD